MILDSRIVDDVEHLRVVFASKDDVREWAEHVTRNGDSYRYIPESWNPKELFAKPYAEIIGFIEDRFRDTEDVQEYYVCMLFLRKTVDAETLFVLWKDSPNFKALQARQNGQNDQVDTNIAPSKKVVNGIGKVGVKSPQSEVKIMKSNKTWRTI